MYKCELCGRRRGAGIDHSKCSKKLQEMHKDRPKPVHSNSNKHYSTLYKRV